MKTTKINTIKTVVMGLLLAGLLAMSVGCDTAGGGYYGGYDDYVAPADFSPYGYDYDMYDIFTEDI